MSSAVNYVVFIIGFMVLALAFVIFMMVSLYRWAKEDAASRGMENPVVWGLIVALVPNLIGLIVYLVVRSMNQPAAVCGQCGRNVPKYAGYCPACGAAQNAPVVAPEQQGPKPTRHLIRAAIAFGCFIVLMIVMMVVTMASGIQGYSYNTQASMISVSQDGTGTFITEKERPDSFEMQFATWDGTRRGALEAEGTLYCEVVTQSGVLWIEIIRPDETIRIDAGQSHQIKINGKQKVEYIIYGEDAKQGSISIKCE